MKLIVALIAMSFQLYSFAECWELKMVMQIPKVVDNATSNGFRKYQTQKIRGWFLVEKDECGEPEITFCSLENLTHKVSGKNVSYDVDVDKVGWHGIGSNKTGKFNTRSVFLGLTCEPSYAIGTEPTEDNSLLITLSGKGKANYIQGYVSGQLGCGCAEYGHKSPTRIWGTTQVVDTAGAYGRWVARRVY